MSVFSITAIGVSAWELNFLQATVAIASGTDISQWHYTSEPAHADVLIANRDSREGAAWLRRAQEHTAAPIVVAIGDGGGTAADGAAASLHRPIVYAELIGALRSLEPALRDRRGTRSEAPVRDDVTDGDLARSEHDTAAAPQAPAMTTAALADAPTAIVVSQAQAPAPNATPDAAEIEATLQRKRRLAVRFFDDTRLLGLLLRAIESGHSTRIVHPGFAPLTIHPTTQVYASAGAWDGAGAFRAPVREFQARPLLEDTEQDPATETVQGPLETLLFNAALFGSEGRLRVEADPDDLLELADESAVAMASLSAGQRAAVRELATGPRGLRELALGSGTTLDEIVDLVNAMEVVGCVRRVRAGRPARIVSGVRAPQQDELPFTATLRRLQALLRSALHGPRAHGGATGGWSPPREG